MKIDANKSMVVIESTPYHIVSAPSSRAWNNLYIEYTIRYDYVKHSTTPSKSNLYSHKECAYYEISRCGDGTLDKEYGEECDPEVAPWKSDHSCEPETCTVKPQGKLKTTKEVVTPKDKIIKNT
jgi:hypothetical protein